MSLVISVVRWILGVFFVLSGLAGFSVDYVIAIVFIVIGLAIIPQVIPFLRNFIPQSRHEQKKTESIDGNKSFSEYVPCDGLIDIEYVDYEGRFTKRVVDVQYCKFEGKDPLFMGECHLRNDRRSFRVSRVQQAIDRETGEVIGDLGKYLRVKYESSPHAILDRVFDVYHDSIHALYYIGKSDGQLRKGERTVLYDFILDLAEQRDIDDVLLKKRVDSLGIPSRADYERLVGRISRQDQLLINKTLQAAQAISDTNKNSKPAELEAIAYLQKRCEVSQ